MSASVVPLCARLDKLQAVIRRTVSSPGGEEAWNAFYRDAAELCDAKDPANDLEVAFRRELCSAMTLPWPWVKTPDEEEKKDGLQGDMMEVMKDTSNGDGEERLKEALLKTPPIHLIQVCIHLIIHDTSFLNGALHRLPSILLTDLIENQSIPRLKTLWPILNHFVHQITAPLIFQRNRYAILKLCNHVLRSLTKAVDTKFCGEILMLLAALYPICDKSAVNLNGRVNTTNQTYYDSQEKFRIIWKDGWKEDELLGEDSSEKKQQDTSGKPASGMVKFVVETKSLLEKQLEVDSVTVSAATDAIPPAPVLSPPTSAKGRKRGRQNTENIPPPPVLTTPTMETPSVGDSTISLTHPLYESFWRLQGFLSSDFRVFEPTAWQDFMQHANSVRHLLSQSVSKEEANARDGKAQTRFVGSKYLTSSQLFPLQLRDPLVRLQLSSQLLFLIHYLQVKSLPVIEDVALRSKFAGELADLYESCEYVIEHAPELTRKGLKEVLGRLFEREGLWIGWKNGSCPEFVKPATEEDLALEELVTKHRRVNNLEKEFESIKEQEALNIKDAMESIAGKLLFDTSATSVKEVVSDLKFVPDVNYEIEAFLEAEDPENGIEEEYHPRNDPKYCWRVRRLLAQHDILLFRGVSDGDIGRPIRRLRGLPEPVVVPVVEKDDSSPVCEVDEAVTKEAVVENNETPPLSLDAIVETSTEPAESMEIDDVESPNTEATLEEAAKDTTENTDA